MNTLRPWLAIGKYRDTLDLSLLRVAGIGAMLQLAEAVPQPALTTLYLPVEDGVPLRAELLRRGVDFALAQRNAGQRVLVACGAGISRSAAFATAAINEAEGCGLMAAFQLVKQAHPDAQPHFVLWESLCAYYAEDVPYLTMIRCAADF